MKTLTIGQVAKRAGVGVETVRFYERQGIIREPRRGSSGYRQFGEEVVAHLRFIKQAKELGFTLKEIKELLSLRLEPGSSCAEVKSKAVAKLADIENRIQTLERMKLALSELTSQCSGQGTTSECPILNALAPEEQEGLPT